jgi:CheY-like chemotaxis protein
MLCHNLETAGFRVEEAGDGQQALTRLTEIQPDLALLDWTMPVMPGIEAALAAMDDIPHDVAAVIGATNDLFDRDARASSALGDSIAGLTTQKSFVLEPLDCPTSQSDVVANLTTP